MIEIMSNLKCSHVLVLIYSNSESSQGCCVNAPMIVVADYSNGSEGYSYNYYVSSL